MGHVGREERDSLIAQSRFTVLPSHAYETLGKTILESYAEGRAVWPRIWDRGGSWFSTARRDFCIRTGDVDQLAARDSVSCVEAGVGGEDGTRGMGDGAATHTPEEHYQKLLSLYEGLVDTKKTRHQRDRKPWMTDRASCRTKRLQWPTKSPITSKQRQPAGGIYRRARSDLEI